MTDEKKKKKKKKKSKTPSEPPFDDEIEGDIEERYDEKLDYQEKGKEFNDMKNQRVVRVLYGKNSIVVAHRCWHGCPRIRLPIPRRDILKLVNGGREGF